MNKLTPNLSFFILLLTVCLLSYQSIAQSNNSPILFIYDASGSMWGKLGSETKKEAAASVLINTISGLESGQKIGFMAYGHRIKSDCKDVELLVELENTSKPKIISAIENINPLGKTPLAYSAELAINKIKEADSKTTIILVTDGIESCNGDLCEVIRLAKQEGIDFKMHIVGFGLRDGETEALKCAAKHGDGNYYNAEDSNQLAEVLDDAISQKIDDPAPNHTFYTTKNGEPVDAWIKITDKNTGKEIRVTRTYKDTTQMYLPIGEYNLTINPLEGTGIASKTLDISKTKDGPSHNTISFNGGTIEVFVTNNGEGWDAVVKVFDRQTQKVVGSNRTYGRKNLIEVNTGIYDVEILALVMKGSALKYRFENVEIKADETNPLAYDYKTGNLKVGVSLQSGVLVDAIINVNDTKNNEYIAGSRTYTSESSNPKSIIIQPGTYEIKITTLGKHKGTIKTDIITVSPGKETSKIFKID